ncbi:sugar ABC transporter permease [Pseudoclavibacter chungangensis]|uniref:Sugar ABC transporter permease n=1 Tax=Pseudoclavibacter chungangensis TaxID=587635 RepID=A0A7J5BPY8_9MICO|nr:sugar ABC transporter permease [Pseudoclavibacter chungangensis]KAB1655397.1 sugar ABC transporter permease [Pseudoclavibacter chungangensis]NYJ68355.1 multiple sugar transport system permease protein [Pseudoclavibacter chungangensis]
MRTTERRAARREAAAGYLLLSPALIGVVLFLLVPIGVLVWLTFRSWDLLGPVRPAGLDNWTAVVSDPAYVRSFLVTAIYVVLVIPVQTTLGVLLATLLSRNLPGSTFVRTVLVLPWVCAPLVLGVVWRWIFRPDGALNALIGVRIEWLTDPWLALPVVAFVSAWSQVGYVTLFFMAGLASIPTQVIEAARIDGASEWRIFWSIKLPLLRPTTFFVLVTSVIASFQAFDLVYALVPDGGPKGTTDLIAQRIYSQTVEANEIGRAAVLALVLFVVLLVVTLAQNAYFSKRMTYDRT